MLGKASRVIALSEAVPPGSDWVGPGLLTCRFVLHRTVSNTPAPTLQAGGRGFESHRLHRCDQDFSVL